MTANHVGQSGQYDGHDGIFAFDNDDGTSWRPDGAGIGAGAYPAHSIWLTFSTVEEIKCVSAENLGEGTGGAGGWNGGIRLESQNENGEWELVFESTSGNTAIHRNSFFF